MNYYIGKGKRTRFCNAVYICICHPHESRTSIHSQQNENQKIPSNSNLETRIIRLS
jgi:hypothetical protein